MISWSCNAANIILFGTRMKKWKNNKAYYYYTKWIKYSYSRYSGLGWNDLWYFKIAYSSSFFIWCIWLKLQHITCLMYVKTISNTLKLFYKKVRFWTKARNSKDSKSEDQNLLKSSYMIQMHISASIFLRFSKIQPEDFLLNS